MGYWYSPSSGYHEGDSEYPDDAPALRRPDPACPPILTTSPISWGAPVVSPAANYAAAIDALSSEGSDTSMSRGLEDLVGLLISKGTIAKTDLPVPLLTKINNRRSVRGQTAL